MHHFDYLTTQVRERLFARPPCRIDRDGDPALLALALGATIYLPANRHRLAHDLIRLRQQGATSAVVCLEDSIRASEVEPSLRHLVAQLETLTEDDEIPLLFIRVRECEQPERLVDLMSVAAVGRVDGFVFPKFRAEGGVTWIDAVARCEQMVGRRLLVMPVLESPEVMHLETRAEELLRLRDLLDSRAPRILAVRIGAADLASAYALRRPRDISVYDIRVVSDAIGDIVNMLGRPDSGYFITGPVWEYFAARARIFKPQLRTTPFEARADGQLRQRLLAADIDGLIREVVLDRANGLNGKTVIHPSHVAVVNALSVVGSEEYADACDILEIAATGGGAARSGARNKMNEAGPHQAWARRLLRQAEIFGVAAPEVTFVDLIGAVAVEVGL